MLFVECSFFTLEEKSYFCFCHLPKPCPLSSHKGHHFPLAQMFGNCFITPPGVASAQSEWGDVDGQLLGCIMHIAHTSIHPSPWASAGHKHCCPSNNLATLFHPVVAKSQRIKKSILVLTKRGSQESVSWTLPQRLLPLCTQFPFPTAKKWPACGIAKNV